MKHKDAKVTTTTIPAHAKLEKPHMRKRNTDLENENFRLKSELSQARRAERLAVLEEVERKVDGTYFNAYPDFYRGVDEMKKAVLEHINKMKESAK